MPEYDPVTKISIVPRGAAGGLTFFAPSEERLESGLYSRCVAWGRVGRGLQGLPSSPPCAGCLGVCRSPGAPAPPSAHSRERPHYASQPQCCRGGCCTRCLRRLLFEEGLKGACHQRSQATRPAELVTATFKPLFAERTGISMGYSIPRRCRWLPQWARVPALRTTAAAARAACSARAAAARPFRRSSYLENQMAVALGGRVAEELIYGPDNVTTGASGDFQQARPGPCPCRASRHARARLVPPPHPHRPTSPPQPWPLRCCAPSSHPPAPACRGCVRQDRWLRLLADASSVALA